MKRVHRPVGLLKKIYYIIACYSLHTLTQASSANLMVAYEAARDYDPTFRKAYHVFLSNRQAIPQALAALKPQLNLQAQAGRNFTEISGEGFAFRQTYNSTQWGLSASQVLFNAQGWAQVQRAQADVIRAQAVFNDAAQDMMIRTAQNYFNVLLAEDTLRFAKAKRTANLRQLNQAKARFQVGIDTITSVYEAQAAYDQSIAEVIAANNDRHNQAEQLRKITNQTYTHFAGLKNASIPLTPPTPNSIDAWTRLASTQNYKLAATRFAVQTARENIKVQFGSGLPTVDLVANTNTVHNQVDVTSFFATQKNTSANAGIQLTFPVYQGGLVQSNTQQARYDFLAASDQFEADYRDVIANTNITFNSISDLISKVKADRQTVSSQNNSLESTQAQFEAGTRTMVDVTNAQQSLFDAQRTLASDQYRLILATLSLKYLAGTLSVSDLQHINQWLEKK